MDSPLKSGREAIILAGGFGLRLRSVVPQLPKVLAPVGGKPFLAHVLGFLERQNFHRVVLAVGYMHDEIIKTIGESFGKLKIEYSIENEPIGTGGAIWKASQLVTQRQDFFALNGDTYIDMNIDAMEEALKEREADLVMGVRHAKDAGRYGIVEVGDEKIVTGFREKADNSEGLINAGIYLIRRNIPLRFPFPGAFSWEKDLLQAHCTSLRIATVVSEGYFVDIGIPEDYERANRDLA